MNTHHPLIYDMARALRTETGRPYGRELAATVLEESGVLALLDALTSEPSVCDGRPVYREDCCNWCAVEDPSDARGTHEPDCPYAQARALLDAP